MYSYTGSLVTRIDELRRVHPQLQSEIKLLPYFGPLEDVMLSETSLVMLGVSYGVESLVPVSRATSSVLRFGLKGQRGQWLRGWTMVFTLPDGYAPLDESRLGTMIFSLQGERGGRTPGLCFYLSFATKDEQQLESVTLFFPRI